MRDARLHAALLIAVTGVASGPAISTDRSHGRPVAASPVDDRDCHYAPDLASREACYARLPSSAIAECEAARLFACAPYRDMHIARQDHAAAMGDLAAAARVAFVDMADGDSNYAAEFADRLRETERTWQAWRDAECALAPLLDGMSRREFDGLTEACRAEMTRARTHLLRAQATRLTDPTDTTR